jgi:hypothetical protein
MRRQLLFIRGGEGSDAAHPTRLSKRNNLALPPDTGESFVREVDENLRRDQLADAAKTYGKWIVAAIILFLAAVGGYLYWQHRQAQQSVADSEALSSALDKVGSGNLKGADAELAPLGNSSSDVTRASALLAQATIAINQNDRKKASALYKQVAGDEDIPEPLRDLATVRGTMVDFDSMKPDDVIARLSALAKPGNAFFGSAGELTGMAMIAKGDNAGAGRLFAQIAADKQVPNTIRSRAVQVASSLGVDASASMPGDPLAVPAS